MNLRPIQILEERLSDLEKEREAILQELEVLYKKLIHKRKLNDTSIKKGIHIASLYWIHKIDSIEDIAEKTGVSYYQCTQYIEQHKDYVLNLWKKEK